MNLGTKRLLLPVGGLALACSGFAAGITVSATAADDPQDAAPVVVTRDPLAEVAPSGHGLDADAGDYLQS